MVDTGPDSAVRESQIRPAPDILLHFYGIGKPEIHKGTGLDPVPLWKVLAFVPWRRSNTRQGRLTYRTNSLCDPRPLSRCRKIVKTHVNHKAPLGTSRYFLSPFFAQCRPIANRDANATLTVS